MYQKSLYMINHVDQVKNEIHLKKYLFNKQVIVNVSKEEVAVYVQSLNEAVEHGSVPFVEYDEERGVIC
ncbi:MULTISPECIES: DUF5511 family protein [Bacillus]|uniref:Uncharacterized protein n=1 Tax=Bacillus thuringiensis subsp. konkukian (strain 97-27) TaxID=281309 RepID=Q5LK57_BACHK|nr:MULTISPECIES: DUF5511 family protein [Bacillus]AAW31048.1 hypothetical protein pBT9727_0078 [[Bacillus thuringiensis] serovar konkukian str. 97-27]MDK7443503.1 DUF5511 family protein [Bacillus paranthracis]MDK7459880.1 DUF5511 family protein [Bacillus paranthracis]MDV6039861.1 DUF5511 family protein [Bacillus sp. SM-B1]QKI23389.1 DUF5511 family protein [Bacillus thuringiensis]